MKRYIVYNTVGDKVGIPFASYKEAEVYKAVYGKPDWKIRLIHVASSRKSTEKQKAAVEFIELWCDIKYQGDINDFYEVSDFLSDYLVIAKEVADDASASYNSMLTGRY